MRGFKGFIKFLFGKRETPESDPPERYNATAVLIGEAVAEYIPDHAIVSHAVFEITMKITPHPNITDKSETIKLTMQIDGNLNVQIAEYPTNAKI